MNDRWLVTAALGCIGAWVVERSSRAASGRSRT
jgi:hypothetical protein